MGSHIATCHPAEVRFPPLPPAEAGTWFSDSGGMQANMKSGPAGNLTGDMSVASPMPLSHQWQLNGETERRRKMSYVRPILAGVGRGTCRRHQGGDRLASVRPGDSELAARATAWRRGSTSRTGCLSVADTARRRHRRGTRRRRAPWRQSRAAVDGRRRRRQCVETPLACPPSPRSHTQTTRKLRWTVQFQKQGRYTVYS